MEIGNDVGCLDYGLSTVAERRDAVPPVFIMNDEMHCTWSASVMRHRN